MSAVAKKQGLLGLVPNSRVNLAEQTSTQLREALMAGRFWPGQRLRIRELSRAMGVSDTPVREAIMQLVQDGGLEMRPGQAINVVKLSLARYLELREIRFLLEGLATAKATATITRTQLGELARLHQELVDAERNGLHEAATIANYRFHFLIYRASQSIDLVTILEGCWLRNGPLLKLLYPHAPPTYAGDHQHLTIIKAIRKRDADAASAAIRNDIVEGGSKLVALLRQIEDGRAAIVERPDGSLRLEFKRKVAA